MTTATPDTEPLSIRAGDSVSWQRDLPAYPAADGWTLKYRLLWPVTGTPQTLTATGAGSLHTIAVSATISALWPAGQASLYGYVERTVDLVVERVSLLTQSITIEPDLATATNHDRRSIAERCLADLETALAAYCAGGQGHIQAYTIGDKSMQFRNTAEITTLIAYYRLEVARQRGARPRILYRG